MDNCRKSFFNTSAKFQNRKKFQLIHKAHTQVYNNAPSTPTNIFAFLPRNQQLRLQTPSPNIKSYQSFQHSKSIYPTITLNPQHTTSVKGQKTQFDNKTQTNKQKTIEKQIQLQVLKQDKKPKIQYYFKEKNFNSRPTQFKSKQRPCSQLKDKTFSLNKIDHYNQQYLDKKAIQSQIQYNKAVHQQYGDKYFEYSLRNRFQDQKNYKSFIYQIKDQFSQTPFIKSLKKYKPHLHDRKKLVLKAKQITQI